MGKDLMWPIAGMMWVSEKDPLAAVIPKSAWSEMYEVAKNHPAATQSKDPRPVASCEEQAEKKASMKTLATWSYSRKIVI